MKNTAAAPSAEKGESNSERVRRYEGTPPDGDMNHGFVISSWTPMETPLDTPKRVDLFRRTVNLESDLFFMVAARSPRELARKHLEWRVGQIKGDLNLALYKFGMLDCALSSYDPKFGLRWIAESMPALDKSNVIEPFLSYFYMRAGSFATLKANWKLADKYVTKGIELLPEDPSKVLWSAELHRLLGVLHLRAGKCKSARECIMKALELAEKCPDYPPALMVRIFKTIVALFLDVGDQLNRMKFEEMCDDFEKNTPAGELCQDKAEKRMEYNAMK